MWTDNLQSHFHFFFSKFYCFSKTKAIICSKKHKEKTYDFILCFFNKEKHMLRIHRNSNIFICNKRWVFWHQLFLVCVYISKWHSHVHRLMMVIFIGPELLAGVTECGDHGVSFLLLVLWPPTIVFFKFAKVHVG